MINDFIEKYYLDKDKLCNYLQELYLLYNNIKYDLNSNYILSYLNTFIPLPSKLIINDLYIDDDKIEFTEDNKYMFLGTNGTRLLFADKILPFNNTIKFPIPFSFPIINNNKLEIYQSNIYYFELSILNEKNNNMDNNDNNISIGFGNNDISFKSHVGWNANSIGFHSNGCIYINSYKKSFSNISDIWKPGDTIGAGILYIKDNIVNFFFTFNGKFVYIFNSSSKLQNPYFPIIGYNHNHTIELNFSQKQFKYDIISLINKYNYIISINNTFLYDDNINNYINLPPTENINYNNQFLNIFNLMLPIELMSIN